jgi:nucleotidyltransferase/DNA polymerase involved in DNA repair
VSWVLHVDLDEFIAAVEVLRRPELAGKPVVVGGRGDPMERGVVSTASYAARAFGVGSGMPLRTAARKCPDAVFLPVDKPAYDQASSAVTLKVRYAPFDTRTRSRTLPHPTADAGEITATALELAAGLDHDRAVRLLGLRAEMLP